MFFSCSAVGNRKHKLYFVSKLFRIFCSDTVVAPSSKESKMRQLWLWIVPYLIQSPVWGDLSLYYLFFYVRRSSSCISPKLFWNIPIYTHWSKHIVYCTVRFFIKFVLLRCVRALCPLENIILLEESDRLITSIFSPSVMYRTLNLFSVALFACTIKILKRS